MNCNLTINQPPLVQSQVLFQGPKAERIFSKVTEDPTVSLDDVKDHLIPDQNPLGIREIVFAKKFAKKYDLCYL